MNTIKKKKKKLIKREYRVYDEADNLIYTTNSRDDLMEKFDIKSTTYIYGGDYFRPNISAEECIRVDIVKSVEEVEYTVEVPASLQGIKSSKDMEYEGSLPGEIWKTIPDFPLYSVSSFGRVLVEIDGEKRLKKFVKSTNANGRNYYDVLLKNIGDKRGSRIRVNRLVVNVFKDSNLPLRTFKGTPVVVHHDGSTLDNSVENVSISSHTENINEGNAVSTKKNKACKATNLKTGEVRYFFNTKLLVKYVTGGKSDNAGYFNHAIHNNGIVHGWKVEYDYGE